MNKEIHRKLSYNIGRIIQSIICLLIFAKGYICYSVPVNGIDVFYEGSDSDYIVNTFKIDDDVWNDDHAHEWSDYTGYIAGVWCLAKMEYSMFVFIKCASFYFIKSLNFVSWFVNAKTVGGLLRPMSLYLSFSWDL